MMRLSTIPAISLWQPWATWVALGWKSIETRTHDRFQSLQGRRIAIHASQKWDSNAIEVSEPFLTLDQVRYTAGLYFCRPRGAIVCTAFVKVHTFCSPDDSAHALIECETVRFGLFLRDVKRIDPPLFMKGRQGIFRVTIPIE